MQWERRSETVCKLTDPRVPDFIFIIHGLNMTGRDVWWVQWRLEVPRGSEVCKTVGNYPTQLMAMAVAQEIMEEKCSHKSTSELTSCDTNA